jgi:PPOX class probable FMN-dependent enzyme
MTHPMARGFPLADVITTEAGLRQVIGDPAPRAVDKVTTRLDDHARAFIARSPLVLVASSDGRGHLDVSPRGDPPGFVLVLDDQTLAIPERPGNRRADTCRNVMHSPHVALLFVIPGKSETLRVRGSARIARDATLRERMAVQGKAPALAVVVSVQALFFHCARCALRSHVWQPEHWPSQQGLASHAQCIVDHAKLDEPVDAVQAALDRSYRDHLY